MKSKTILTATLLFLFSLPVYAGLCFPTSQIYTDQESKTEKFTPIGGLLNRFTYPIPTNSYSKSDIAYDGFTELCGGKSVENLQRLSFKDFSVFDKIKIIINVFVFAFILLFPLGIFVLVYRRIKALPLKIVLDVLLIFVYLFWIFRLLMSWVT
ncbi:MAG: hypothetical protein A2259_00320 [Candidatus Moranbacteria bacterium RIFOXYA2_FULL_43_15]|nr:MAG: hypothetical protein A2259_00320 [Candidatus Moranbacteria bacterium RIFOXYA2_FULL_43_15]